MRPDPRILIFGQVAGLIGTIAGMVRIFREIAWSAVPPRMEALLSGIGSALATTLICLPIAIALAFILPAKEE